MRNRIFALSLIVVIISSLFYLGTHSVFADTLSLSVSPSIMEITANPSIDVSAPFTLTNSSDQPVTLRIGYKMFDSGASKNGIVSFLSNVQTIPGPDQKIFDKIHVVNENNISIDSINLGPKQTKKLGLRITLPHGEPASDYYFTLLFIQTSGKENQNTPGTNVENQKSYSLLQAGIGMNVLLSVGNKEKPVGSIDTYTTSWFHNSGPTLFNLTVHNQGQHFFTAKGTILIRNMFGQTVGKITLPPTIILAGTSRSIASIPAISNAGSAFDLSDENTATSPSILWPEKFILGLYTAKLSLSLSDGGPVFTRTIHFFGLPLQILVLILVVLVTLLAIFLRVKRRVGY